MLATCQALIGIPGPKGSASDLSDVGGPSALPESRLALTSTRCVRLDSTPNTKERSGLAFKISHKYSRSFPLCSFSVMGTQGGASSMMAATPIGCSRYLQINALSGCTCHI